MRVYPDIGVYTDIGVSDIGVTPMSEFLISHPMFFSWQVLGTSGRPAGRVTALSNSCCQCCQPGPVLAFLLLQYVKSR
jgi:hypothetical protein